MRCGCFCCAVGTPPKTKNPNPSLSRKGLDLPCLVRVVIQNFLKTIVVQFIFETIGWQFACITSRWAAVPMGSCIEKTAAFYSDHFGTWSAAHPCFCASVCRRIHCKRGRPDVIYTTEKAWQCSKQNTVSLFQERLSYFIRYS